MGKFIETENAARTSMWEIQLLDILSLKFRMEHQAKGRAEIRQMELVTFTNRQWLKALKNKAEGKMSQFI